MSNYHSGQQVKLKDETIPLIADQMAEDLSLLIGEIGILHGVHKSDDYPVQWDWYFDSAFYGNIPIFEDEIESVQS